ncbi:imelysin family protein [Nitrosomonas sp.]|uniref:imelysin family protein n=1 Tax=Nitrosomonas sp. TaxID=42353 RepID=UPI00272694F4|nr:imelysin family protein [Nitrosomonas sp.]MDO8895091.1 imelysin family protein [Nitrosomonas sp.]
MKNWIKPILAGVAIIVFADASHAELPETPKLYITTNGPQVSLYWDEVSGANNYTLIASNLNDGAFFGQFDVGANTQVSTSLPEGSGFFVSVRAENAAGSSNFSLPNLLVVPPVSTVVPSVEQVIQNYARNVVFNTYTDLAEQTKILRAAVIELQFDTTDKSLHQAQNAWRNARRPWEQSEAFLFGPVDTEGLDPALDSWPINGTDIQNVMSSDTPLTAETVSAFEPTLKGFHVIEYLLFGNDNSKTASELTTRELAYLIAAATVLSNDAQVLAKAWNPNDKNFLSVFSQAGAGSTTYPSLASALQEMVEGMIVIADEVANGKLSKPLMERDTTLVESQFSSNSRSDFMNNIRGLRNVYTGNYLLSEGPGLNALVKSINPALDEAINSQIEKALAAIQAIPQPFTESIVSNAALVQEAIDEVKSLLALVIDQLLPLVPSV